MDNSEKLCLENAIRTRIKRLDIILDGEIHNPAYKQDQQHDESVRLDNFSHAPVDAALTDLAKMERERLKDNLGWIKENDAGICEECGCNIPIQRLLAVPTTRRCVKCAGKE